MSKALDNEMRRYILSELSTKKDISFSELFNNKFYSSSQFTYHLNWLLKKDFVFKKEGNYSLGTEGKKLMNYVSSGEIVNQPLLIVGVVLKKGNKILISRSKKEPLDGYWGLSCFGKYDDVTSIVKEKTGLSIGKYNFGGVFDIRTTDIKLRHQMIVFYSEDFTGKLMNSEMRETKWVTRKELKKMKQFPENEFILDNMSKGFFIIERNISEMTYKVLLKSI